LLAAMVLAYCVSSPHTLIYFGEVVEGLLRTWSYETGVFPDAAERGPGLYQYGWTQLREGMGIPLHLMSLAAVAYALVRRSREQLLLLAALLPYFVLTTFASWVVVRYTVPMVPMLALLIAAGVVAAMRTSQPMRLASAALLIGALSWTLLSDLAFLRIQAGRNVREEAADWIIEHAPAKSGIATVWQYNTDVYSNPVIRGDFRVFAIITDDNAERALSSGVVDFLVVNETVYKNMDRLGDRHPYEGIRAYRKAFEAAPYRLVAEFQKPVTFAGLDFSGTFTSQDYGLINPGIRIYQRDSAGSHVK
jgi:hypothetical protein